MDDESQGFEVVDKRRDKAEDTAATPAEVTEAGADEPEEAQEEVSYDVSSLLVYMLNLLGASAWQWMGVVVNPATGKAETDLGQARLAIDAFEAIANVLKAQLDEGEMRQVQQGLNDLRVNWVERAQKEQSSE